MDELMPIGEFSQRSGLSPKRLRTYATAGLLAPASVDSSSGYRYYAPDQLRAAQLIEVLRQAGMPLADIAPLLRDPTRDQLDAWAARVETEAAVRHEALDVARGLLANDASSRPRIRDESTRRATVTQLKAACRTEIGQVREKNDDAVAADDHLAVVADGMGGHRGGEVASAMALSLVTAAFTGRSLDELQAAVRAANRAIWERAGTKDELEGMGTTVCAAGVTADGLLAVVNVGDSRAYMLRNGALHQLTRDHSVTAELVSSGELSEPEARHHPLHGYLTRALGVGPDVEVDGATHVVTAGDRLLMCSDGLFNDVPDAEIASVAATTEIESAVDALVELAQARGGRDNISVVIADICRRPEPHGDGSSRP